MPNTIETPIFVRTSERALFTKCRQHWWWAYVERRRPTDFFSVPLVFGDLVHRSLAEYYVPETRKRRKRGPHPSNTFARLYDLAMEDRTFNVRVDDEKWMDARDLGQEMMTNYINYWKDEDKDILVLYPEMPFQYPLYDIDGKFLCLYVGTTDALIRRISTGHYGLFEHKTAASISTAHLFMDEQASTYWAIVPRWLRDNGIIKPEEDLHFMLYNFMRKKGEDDRPQNSQGQYLNKHTKKQMIAYGLSRGWSFSPSQLSSLSAEELEKLCRKDGKDPTTLGDVSKSQPPPLFERLNVRRGEYEQEATITRIRAQVKEMNLTRRGKMAHYKAPSRDCSFCEFRDICELEETGDDWIELRRMMTRKWEPYRDHVWDLALS